MSLSRNLLLWASQNKWMKQNVPKLFFVKKALRKFMPGEDVDSAIIEALRFKEMGIGSVFTKLGENIQTLEDAGKITAHYLEVLDKIEESLVPSEISLKLTQIGFDISPEAALKHFELILKKAQEKKIFIWIDMEQSSYTQRTIDFYKQCKRKYDNVGICLQAYLRRTMNDLNDLLPLSPNIRLVKGAYMELPEKAFAEKAAVDRNYIALAQRLLDYANDHNVRIAFATHDLSIISEVENYAATNNIPPDRFEFQMLYGIKPSEQIRISKKGYNILVLISYGDAWYSWYMRRLAERPANVWFVLQNILTK